MENGLTDKKALEVDFLKALPIELHQKRVEMFTSVLKKVMQTTLSKTDVSSPKISYGKYLNTIRGNLLSASEDYGLEISIRVPCTFVRKYTLRGNRFSIKQIWRGVLSVRKQLLIGDKSLSKTYYFSLRFCNYFLKDWKALVLVEMPPFQKRPFVKEKNP